MSFEKIGESEIEGIRAHCDLYRHKKHGCQFLNVKNDDPNNTFVIAFRTFPENDKGIAHVTEHMTLDGSKKYPVTGLFFELDKRSVATFLNAFTYPDLTGYPLASMNEVDFHNLMDVYLDTVFNPLYDEDTFKTECHHLEFTEIDNPESPLQHCGVVYNEMKGVYSSADQYFDDFCNFNTFPKTIYANNYGGFPKAIETLTREELVEFHNKYYHPSNCFIIHYGTFDEHKIMEHVDQFLSKIDVSNVDPTKGLSFFPPHQDEPRKVVIDGPLDTSADPEKQTRSSITWIVGKRTDIDLCMDIKLLQKILLGSEATPLYDSLIKSEIGSNFVHHHFTKEFKPLTFSIGLKGMKPENVEKFEKTVFDTLQNIVKNGISDDVIQAGLHDIKIKSKKIGSNHGLNIFEDIIHQWMDGCDVLSLLNDHLDSLTKRVSQKGYLENLISKLLIQNKNRTLFVVNPSEEFNNKNTKEEKQILEKVKSEMTEDDKKNIIEVAQRLKAKVENERENTETLPQFKKEFLSLDPIKSDVKSDKNIDCVTSGCNGIVTIRVNGTIPIEKDIDPTILAIAVDCVDSLGTSSVNDTEFSLMKQRYATDCFSYLAVKQDINDKDKVNLVIRLGAKCLQENLGKTIEILRMMIESNFFNEKKLKELLDKWNSDVVDDIIDSGSYFASLHSSRYFNRKTALVELTTGLTKYQKVRELSANSNISEVSQIFSEVYKTALKSALFRADIHATESDIKASQKQVSDFVNELNNGKSEVAESDFTSVDKYITEQKEHPKMFIAFDSQTNFIGISTPIEFYTKKAILTEVSSEFLSQEVIGPLLRENMGCYGAYVTSRMNSSYVSISSYRDGAPKESTKAAINAMNKSLSKVDEESVDRAILSVSKTLDRPFSPHNRAQVDIDTGVSYEKKKEIRETAFKATVEEVKESINDLINSQWTFTVLGNKDNLPDGFELVNF